MPDRDLIKLIDTTGRLRYKHFREYALARSRQEFTDQFAHPLLVSAALCEGSIGEQEGKERTMSFSLAELNGDSTKKEDQENDPGELQRSIYPLFKQPISPAEPAGYSIGRVQGNDFMLVDFTISRRHAQIKTYTPTAYSVTDCGSLNGSMLNDQPLAPETETTLEPGNKLRFGRFQFFFLTPMLLYILLRKES